MREDEWSRVDAILEATLDKAPIDRARFLAAACAGDAALEQEVRRLLALAEEEDDVLVPERGLDGPLWADVVEELGGDEHLETGQRIGDFEITGFLGRGGMGSVYRARDRDLEREVAIKALSKRVAPDVSFVRRFQREAKLLASLNHPNIGAIYDLVIDNDHPYLILELVEGETLFERLARGRIPTPDALRIALQLVEGIEAAHNKGVVHRDLKPGNVTINTEGRVKILDFGLAKSRDEEPPARSEPATTQTGIVLGTPSYMSPEQARGDVVDERTDIWSFGCIVYEMLTGARCFRAGSASDTVAAVLRDDVDWSLLPEEVPSELHRLLRRCLEKTPNDRFQNIGTIRVELAELSGEELVPRSETDNMMFGVVLGAAALVLALAAIAYFVWFGAPGEFRLENPVQLTSTEIREDFPAYSPDGQMLVYASMSGSSWDLYVQRNGNPPVNRSTDFDGIDYAPSWSPDGREIAFRSERDGGGIFAISSESGAPRKLVEDGDAVNMSSSPQFSPDGKHLAYAVFDREQRGVQALEILTLASGESRVVDIGLRWNCLCQLAWSPDGKTLAYVDAQDPNAPVTQLFLYRFEDATSIPITDGLTRHWSPSFSPDGSALFYVSDRRGTSDLWRQQLRRDGSPAGDPVAVTAGVGMRHANLSPRGDRLVYSRGRRVGNLYRVPYLSESRASWPDVEQLSFDQAYVEFVDVSPDGKRAVVSSDRAGNPDLWEVPTDGGDLIRLTDDPTPDWLPAFSPDGRAIAFYAYRSGNRDLWIMPGSGGPARQLTNDAASDASPGWSADGREIYFYSNRDGNVDLWSIPIGGGEPRRLVEDPGTERFPRASPDGQWLSYTSSREGSSTVWIQPASGGERQAVVTDNAFYPIWTADSDGLLFTPGRTGGDDIWRVSLDGSDARPITDLGGRVGRLARAALATDGAFVYFVWEQDLGDLWVMDVEDGR